MPSSVYALTVDTKLINSVDTITRDTSGSNYTSPPDVAITGGGGTGATAVANLISSGIGPITVDIAGSDYTTTPKVEVTGGGGEGALATAKLVATSVVNPATVTDNGQNYLFAPTVTFSLPEEAGQQAEGTAQIISQLGIVSAVIVQTAGSGYTNPPTITLSGGGGSGAEARATLVGTSVDTITVDDAGSGYTTVPAIEITEGGGSGAEASTELVDTGVDTFTVTNGGINYTSVPSVDVTGGGGSGATGTAVLLEIDVDTNILSSDITITADQLSPGGGGILRVYFGFNFDSTPGSISVFNNGLFKGVLNADNDSQIVDNGYYRFDIDVEAGDNINFQLNDSATATEITSILNGDKIRAHLVLLGA